MSKPPPLLTGTAPGAIKLEEGTIVTPPAAEPDPLADTIPPRAEPPAAEPVDEAPPAEAPAPETPAETDDKASTTRKRGAAEKPAEAPAAPAPADPPRKGARGRQRGAQPAAEVAPPAPADADTVDAEWLPPEPMPVPTVRRIPAYLYSAGVSAARGWVKARETSAARWTAWVEIVERMRADGVTEAEIATFAATQGAPVPPPRPAGETAHTT